MEKRKKFNTIIADNLKNIRLEKKLTQKDVANGINITPRCYCYYEKGDREVPLYVIVELSKYYEIGLSQLFYSDRTMCSNS